MTAPDEDRAPAGGQSATTALPQSMQLDGLALPVGEYRFRVRLSRKSVVGAVAGTTL
jgi:hypothetical protein